jgi:NADH dehydrogenase
VHDVTTAFARALTLPAVLHRSFDLVGPREYTLRELQLLVRDTLGVRKPLVHVPLPLMRLGVRLFRLLPDPPITHDELTMLLTAGPSDPAPAVEAFGLDLRTVEDELPAVLRAVPAAPGDVHTSG